MEIILKLTEEEYQALDKLAKDRQVGLETMAGVLLSDSLEGINFLQDVKEMGFVGDMEQLKVEISELLSHIKSLIGEQNDR